MLSLIKKKIKNRIFSSGILNQNKPSTEKLHLGCGPVQLSGWTNVDITASRATDFIDDIRTLKKIENNSISEVYACHVLEHFSHSEVLPVLSTWYNKLKPGGRIRISVPDIDKIVKIYLNNWEHFQTPGNAPWIGLIYGGQLDPYDFHKTGFNFCWLSHLLSQVGFHNIEEYPNEPHFAGDIIDASVDKKTFNDYISLNVTATK